MLVIYLVMFERITENLELSSKSSSFLNMFPIECNTLRATAVFTSHFQDSFFSVLLT